MGIQGLLPQLKSIMVPIKVEELRGQTVAVDTYSWLHKGALSCSDSLCKGIRTTRFPSRPFPGQSSPPVGFLDSFGRLPLS
jgi:hypothetical protein